MNIEDVKKLLDMGELSLAIDLMEYLLLEEKVLRAIESHENPTPIGRPTD